VSAPDPTIPRYDNASPGVGGAIKDFVSAAARAIAPRSITQRQGKIDQSVDSPGNEDTRVEGNEVPPSE
jgi:hypothetical protein